MKEGTKKLGGNLCRELTGENGTEKLLLSKNSFDSLCALCFIESKPQSTCVPKKKLWGVCLFVCFGFVLLPFMLQCSPFVLGKVADMQLNE